MVFEIRAITAGRWCISRSGLRGRTQTVFWVSALFLLFVPCLGAAAQEVLPRFLPMQLHPVLGVLQVEELRSRLETAENPQERFLILQQLLSQLQSLRASDDVVRTFREILQLPQMNDPATQFFWVSQYGLYLERQGRALDAAQLYQSYLNRRDGITANDPQAAALRLRLLGAYIQAGQYREAKKLAFEVLDATGSATPVPLINSLMDLAESDMLNLTELDRLEGLLLGQAQFRFILPRLVRLYNNQGRPQQAVQVLDRLLVEDPQYFLTILDVALEAYTQAQGEQAPDYLLKRLDEVQGGPNDVYDLIRARWLDRIGRTEEAFAFLEGRPADSRLYQQELASLYFAHGKYSSAAQVYQRLVEMDPLDMTSLRYWGESLFRDGQSEQAAMVWERIPEAAQHSVAGYQMLADIYQGHRQYDKAVQALKKARGRPGASEVILVTRILDLLLEQGQEEQLLKEYLQFSLEQPGQEVVYRNRIVEQVTDVERVRRLQEVLSRRLKSDPDPVRLQYLRQLGVDLWVRGGEYDQAIDFVSKAFAGSPELGLRLFNLGFDLDQRNAPEHAIRAWSLVPPESPYYVQACSETAQLSFRLGLWDQSRHAALQLMVSLLRRYPGGQDLSEENLSAASLEPLLGSLRNADWYFLAQGLSILARVEVHRKQPAAALGWLLLVDRQPGATPFSLAHLLLGHAYSQLGSLETARHYYQLALQEAAPGEPERWEAEFFLAECALWEENTQDAMNRYFDLAKAAPEGDFANEALRRYLVVAFAGAEQLYHYSLATLFDWKGDRKEAIRLYREAAADDAESDVAGWCLLEVARLLAEGQEYDAAQRQLAHILERYDHPTLQAESRVLQAKLQLAGKEGTAASATEPLRGLIMDFPDTIYSDLARLNLEGRLSQPL